MKLHELFSTIHFKGTVKIYNCEWDTMNTKCVDEWYVKSSSIEELKWGDEDSDKDTFFYKHFLKSKEVKYFSLQLNEAWLELWVCIEKVGE